MWNIFYRNTRLLILTICLILVWGLSSYYLLPRMEDPLLSQDHALVLTRFPGASAYRVESLVTEKIEEALFEIPEINKLDSTSSLGISIIDIDIKDEVSDVDDFWARVRDKLDDVAPQLPQGVLGPEYEEIEARAYGMIVALTWNLSTPANYAILGRMAQELEDELRSLTGTEKVEFFGTPEEEIVVEISPADLGALELTPQDLSEQIRMSDAKVAAGQLRSNRNDLLIEVAGELDSLARIQQIPIRFGNSGQFARLGDIALVKKGIRYPPSNLALVDGKPAVVLGILVEPSQRLNQWSQTAHQLLEKFQERLDTGIGLQVILDQNLYVERRLSGLLKNLLFGVLLVSCSTGLMMGWKSALIVSSTLPLSILMVFGGMHLLKIPLHQMSVTGLVIALGLLIDNAIVIVDEVQNLLKSGLKPQQAISRGVSQLAIPLLASTLTTVLAFMPIALMPGPVGEFVSSIGISVILALLSSLFLTLTVIPALTGRMHQIKDRNLENRRTGDNSASKIHNGVRNFWNYGLSIPLLTSVYRRFLKGILRHPMLGVILALIIPMTGFLMVSNLEEQFFPSVDREQFQIEFELQTQASLEQTQSLILQAREIMLQHPEIVNVHWFVGENAPSFYYNLIPMREDAANYAQAFVQLKSPVANQLLHNLQDELDQAFPSAQVLVRLLEQGPPISAPIEIRLYGPDLEILRELGNQVRGELAQLANVTHTRSQLSEALPKLELQVDEDKARLVGLDNTSIAQQMDTSLEGSLGGSVLEGTEELPVRVRLSNANRSDLNQITSLDLLPDESTMRKNSSTIPLSSLGELELVPEIATISRRNGRRVNTVQAFIRAGVLPSTVLADFQQRLEADHFQLPPGYSFDFGGESADRQDAVGNLMSRVGVLLVLMVATLVLSFGSFRLAAIVALVGFCSIGLGLASLWLFDYPLGFMAILGTVGLVGVAINDSIVVLASLRSSPQARQGNRKAILEVIIHSTRHVLTTTITTIVGFVPLLFDGGSFWPPLAICVVGGLGGSTLLALFFVPCVYLLLSGRSRRYPRQQLDEGYSDQVIA